MSKKKLSILTISLASGGAEKVISLLLKELIKDYEVTLFLFYNEIHFPIPKEVKVIFFKDQIPQKSSPIFRFLDFIAFSRTYTQNLKRLDIQFAISFLAFPNLLNGLVSLWHRKRSFIISERGFPSDNTTSKLSLFISKLCYPILYNRCDKLFSNSVHINKDLQQNFGITIPMEVIYNPIEMPKKIRVPVSFWDTNNPYKIITVGTLNLRKNHIMILRALNELKSQDGFNLTVLGGGHLEDELKLKSLELNVENQISFPGKVKNVGDFLITNDCFVLSSFTEGFPNALLEAMSYGLPCISTNCLSGPLELLNDNQDIVIEKGKFQLVKYGILVNNDDHIALSKAILYLKNNPEQQVHYSKMSIERSKIYDLPTVYEQFKNFIHS